MANSLGIDLTDKVLVLKKSAMSPQYQDLRYRLFRAEGGFGCAPYTMGTAVMGTFLSDGEEARMEGYDFDRVATDDDLAVLHQS